MRAEATIAVVAHLDEALSLHSGVFTALYEAYEPYKSLGPVTVLPRVVQSDAAVASRSHAAELGTHIRKPSEGSVPCASTTVKRSESQFQGLGWHGN